MADHIAEWVRLTEEKSAQVAPKSKSESNPKGSGRHEGGINAAVRDLGLDRSEAQRSVKIAAIGREAREVADKAGLDTQTARLAIARADDQVAEAKRLAAEKAAKEQAKAWENAQAKQRKALQKEERRHHIAEWVKITDEKLQSPHGAAIESKRVDGKGHRKEEAISAAARDLGISKDSVQRAVDAESLPPEAKAAADAAGIGTVKRAKIAVENAGNTEAQVAEAKRLGAEKAAREQAKAWEKAQTKQRKTLQKEDLKENRDTDNVITLTLAEAA